jgi:uncharacterized membrane protein YecN with MAPEG domain
MTVPQWVLLAFAAWTLALLVCTVGVSRWSKVLSGRAKLTDFPADTPHGSPAYRRMMRAHANCVENLPLYTAVVVAATAISADTPRLDLLALTLMGARVLQTLTHVSFTETTVTVALRFVFFFAQVVSLVWMGLIVASLAR